MGNGFSGWFRSVIDFQRTDLTFLQERRDAFPPRDREQLPLPTQPPYTAHLGNMAFETTSGDVNDFFRDCDVTNVRIVEDKLEHKPKGFGYVEFGSLEGLKKALAFSGSSLGGRSIRVSVADPRKYRFLETDKKTLKSCSQRSSRYKRL